MEDTENPRSSKHKEQEDAFILKFVKDCRKVYSKFAINPFCTSQFQKINLPVQLYPEVIVDDATKLFTIGREQYNKFVDTRFIKGSADVVNTSISKNSLKLPRNNKVVSVVSPLIKLTGTVMAKLRDACENRRELAKELFKYEFTGVPECMYDPKQKKPYRNNKSQLMPLSITPPIGQRSTEESNTNGLVVDLSVNSGGRSSLQQKRSNLCSFEDFVRAVLQCIMSMGSEIGAHRIDIVADTYHPTRQERGSEKAPRFLDLSLTVSRGYLIIWMRS